MAFIFLNLRFENSVVLYGSKTVHFLITENILVTKKSDTLKYLYNLQNQILPTSKYNQNSFKFSLMAGSGIKQQIPQNPYE